MSEAGKIVEAEKGRNLSPQNLHIRLRVVEAVVLVSLLLNLVQGFLAIQNNANIKSQVNADQQESNPR